MKTLFKIIFPLLLIAAISGCGVQRYLPPGERLYRGASVKVNKSPLVKTSTSSLKSSLKSATRPKKNKFFLNQPWKVWWYYVIGEPKRQTGLKAFLRSRLGEPPVLSSRVNPKTTAENLQSYLENNGYFHSKVTGDTAAEKSYLRATYTAEVMPRYTIRNITWVSDSSPISKELIGNERQQRRSLLKKGDYYQLSVIQAERDRLDQRLKLRGYYFFNPDYLMAYADSTIGNYETDLYLNIKNTTPEMAKHAYKINDIVVFPNYSLLNPPPDTSRRGMFMVDSIYVRDTVKNFEPFIFSRAITYRPGKLYSSRDQNNTLNRFINLGVFKFVKNRFEPVADTTKHLLNAFYYLTPAKKKSIQAELDGFYKDSRYVGTQLSVNWKNRNAFKGAELLMVKAYGGLEVSLGDSLKGNNNFRLGGEASLTIPRFVTPFFRIRENALYPPNTRFLLGYEYFIKQSLYAKNIFRAQYEYNWKQASNVQHTLAPIAISYLRASRITDSFYKAVIAQPALLLNVYNEAILGTFYSYTYNTRRPMARNQWYFNGSVDLSGNIAGLITGAKGFREKTIFGTPFAQYVKLDAELRYTKRFRNDIKWANRVQVGIGMPYNNSRLLPFSKQYVIGGPSSLRGFPVRTVGPGTYRPTDNDQRYFQIIGGDYRLLANTELRIPITGIFGGAVFLDAGNIWTKDTITFGPKAKLTKKFLNEMAIAGGVGLRVDVNILLIRLDLGIPLRKPYEGGGFNKFEFGDRVWRRENLILNIAIGYPF